MRIVRICVTIGFGVRCQGSGEWNLVCELFFLNLQLVHLLIPDSRPLVQRAPMMIAMAMKRAAMKIAPTSTFPFLSSAAKSTLAHEIDHR